MNILVWSSTATTRLADVISLGGGTLAVAQADAAAAVVAFGAGSTSDFFEAVLPVVGTVAVAQAAAAAAVVSFEVGSTSDFFEAVLPVGGTVAVAQADAADAVVSFETGSTSTTSTTEAAGARGAAAGVGDTFDAGEAGAKVSARSTLTHCKYLNPRVTTLYHISEPLFFINAFGSGATTQCFSASIFFCLFSG